MNQTETPEELARKSRNAYMRNWRKENPEKVKAINTKFYLNQAKKLLNKEVQDE